MERRMRYKRIGVRVMVAFAGGIASAAVLAGLPAVKVCANANYHSPCTTLRQPYRDLSELGLANAISSFSIESGAWLMCTRRDFHGVCRVFDESERDLSGSQFQDSIVSLRPMNEGGWDGDGAHRDEGAAVLFEDADFRGQRIAVTDHEPDLARRGFNDRVSSVRLDGGRWQLCSDAGFRGRCVTVDGSVNNFADIGLNDQISSLRRLGGDDGGGNQWGNAGGDGDDGGDPDVAVLYEDANFSGRQILVTEGVRDLGRWGFNDRVSSVRLQGGRWQACTDADFSGRCVVLYGNVKNIEPLGMNDQISSIRRMHDGGNQGWGGGGGGWSGNDGNFGERPHDAAVLYADADYRGRQLRIVGEVADLSRLGFNDQVSSMRMSSGRWEVCSDANFRGRCQVVSGNVANFDRSGMNDRISSVRQLQ